MPRFISSSTRLWMSVGAGLALAVAGCGGDSDETPTPSVDAFIGTWGTPTGTQGATCISTEVPHALSDLVIAETSDGGLSVTDGPCTLTLAVSGSSASLSPASQTCTVESSGITGTLTFSAYSFTTTDGKSGRKLATGSIAATALGQPITCSFAADANFTKR